MAGNDLEVVIGQLLPELTEAFGEMVRRLVDHFYYGVTRYTTSSFLRLKPGEALQRRNVAPHIYESAAEARDHLREPELKARLRDVSFVN
jgi:propionate CoA-transferase